MSDWPTMDGPGRREVPAPPAVDPARKQIEEFGWRIVHEDDHGVRAGKVTTDQFGMPRVAVSLEAADVAELAERILNLQVEEIEARLRQGVTPG